MVMTVKELQEMFYREYKGIGLEDTFNKHGKIGDIAEIGLVCEEIGEVETELRERDVDIQKVKHECIDVIVRILSFLTRKGIYLDEKDFITVYADNLKRNRHYSEDCLK